MTSTSFADRPPPDPERLLAALDERVVGETPPGNVTQALKRAGLDEFLAETLTALQQAGADTAEVVRVLEAWNRWERGVQPPGPALDELDEAGLRPFLERARDAQREAFGP
ncbi:MAG TPA: hypothetical protein VF230_17735 [Acidimicrobiales bacterium]